MMSGTIRSLAIFKTNYLGDNVVFVPVVQALRRLRPDWQITLITSPREEPLYSGCIQADDLLLVEPERLKGAWRNPLEFGRWCKVLRKREVEASLVSYDQSSTAHALARIAGGRYRVGGSGLRIRGPAMLTETIACGKGWSIARWNWEMARALLDAFGGARDLPADPPPPDFSHLTAGVQRSPTRIVIHGGSKWIHTRWPLERFAELAGRLARDHEVVWIRVPETQSAALPAEVAIQECADVGSLARLLSSAGLFVGNNSGPMHLANALGTPLVALTGASAPEWNPVWYPHRTRVIWVEGLACAPCERIQFSPGRCLNEQEPLACLRRIALDEVEAECRSIVGRTGGSQR